MQLFVVRHAIAEDAAPGQADADRSLTDEGERKFRGAVRGMKALGWRFDRVLTSPWLRAARTAELLGPISEDDPIETPLLCQPPTTELLAYIAEPTTPGGERRTTAVVGHEPWLGELVGWLAFGDPRHGDALVIKKGGVVWLEGSSVPGGMQLRAIVPPKLSRAMR